MVDSKGKGNRKGTRPQGKLAKGAAARREAERRRRRLAIGYTTGVAVALAALVAVIIFQGREPAPIDPEARAAAESAAGCTEVQQLEQASSAQHINPSQQPTDWNSTPPTSGQHLANPLPRGIFTTEQDMRAAVHNLEHGYMVITYKNLAPEEQRELNQFADEHGGDKLVIFPWTGLQQDGLALTAWQNLQTCERVDLTVLNAFADDFMVPGASKTLAPEPGAA